jgi:hypothetical protein
MRNEDFITGRFDTTFLAGFEPRLNSMITMYEKVAAVVAALEKTKNPRSWHGDHQIRHSRWRNAARTQATYGYDPTR